ncbi:MAG: DUF805 domain-containing protein [Gammaproteobacteria bacterium]|nr:DUF805 domain-containing protein [Gammaproteobacteria bacterium]
MSDNMETTPSTPSNTPKRPRYLPPEPEKSSWLSKPSKSPQSPTPRNSDEPPALPAFSNSLFSYKGRLGRLSLQAAFLGFALIICLLIFVLTIVAIIIGVAGNFSSLANNPASIGIGFGLLIGIPIILMLIYNFVFYVRRLHDLNRSGWWILLPLLLPIPFGIISAVLKISDIPGSSFISSLAAIVNGLFFLYILIAPGTSGVNQYGPPRQTPSHEKVMGWIQILLMALMLPVCYMVFKTFSISHPHLTNTSLTTSSLSAPAAANGKYNAPYPFTAQQLWSNILKVTALPNGNLNQTLIENSFGTTLQTETLPIIGKILQAHAGTDWYFSLKLMPMKMFGQNMEIFTFDWGDQSGSLGTTPPAGMCINVNDIKPSLLNQGWTAKPQDASNQIQSKIEYDKDNNSGVIIAYDADTKCLKQLNLVSATKT